MTTLSFALYAAASLSQSLPMKGRVAAASLAVLCAGTTAAAQDVTLWNLGEANVSEFSEYIQETFPGDAKIQVYPNEAYKTVLQVAIGAGNQPDAFFNWGGEGTFRFIRAGKLRDLTDAAEAAGIPKPLLAPYSMDGERVYGMPLTQHTVSFLYNQPIFERIGVEPPDTLEEFEGVCRAIRAADPDIIPVSFGAKEPWTITHYLTMLFHRHVPADVRRADDALATDDAELYAHPGYVKGLDALRGLQDAGCFNRGINSVAPEEARSFFALEISAMTFCGTWCLDPVDQDGLKDRYSLFPMPKVPGGAGDQEAVFVVPEGFNISADAADPEATEALLAYIYSADVQAEMVRRLGRVPVNAAALEQVETTSVFSEAVALTANAPSTVMAADMTMNYAVGREMGSRAQEFINRAKSAEEVMDAVRAEALRTKARQIRRDAASGQ